MLTQQDLLLCVLLTERALDAGNLPDEGKQAIVLHKHLLEELKYYDQEPPTNNVG